VCDDPSESLAFLSRVFSDPAFQQRDLFRLQRIGIFRHQIVLVLGDEACDRLALLRFAGNDDENAGLAAFQRTLAKQQMQFARLLDILNIANSGSGVSGR
jgi:hypothetical protein